MKSLIGLFGCVLLGAVVLYAAAPTGIEIRRPGGVSGGTNVINVTSNSVVVSAPGGTATNAFKTYLFETNTAPILSNLIASTSSGDLIELGVGDFRLGLQNIILPVGVTLRGKPGATRIISKAPLFTNGPIITIASSNTVENLEIIQENSAIWYQAAIGFNSTLGHRAATNVTLRNIRAIDGQSDIVFMRSDDYYEVRGYDCFFKSKWDTYAQVFETSTGTNYCVWRNTYFESDFKGATFPDALVLDTATPVKVSGLLELYNCTVIATNGVTSVGMTIQTEGSQIHVYGGRFEVAGTNSAKIGDNVTFGGDPTTSPFRFFETSVKYSDLEAGSFAIFNNQQTALAIADTNIVGKLVLPGVATNNLVMTGGQSNLTAVTIGANLTFSGGTLAATGGATPAGNSGDIQFNETGALAGTNEFHFNRTNRTLQVPLGVSVNSGLNKIRLTNNSLFTDGISFKIGASGTNNLWVFVGGGNEASSQLVGDIVPGAAGYPYNIGNVDPSLPVISEIRHAKSVVNIVSNRVFSAPGAASTVTLYGTNQYWNVNITSNITFADSALNENVVYWIKATNNASTVAYPGTWRWISGPALTTAPSLQGGEYIIRVQKFENGTNAWVETGPSLILVAGPGHALTTNGNTVTINQAGFQTLAYTDVTNCIFNMALGYNALITLTNNVGFDQPINLRAGADFKIYVAQDSVGTREWWFNTNYWQFNVFPYLPVETNATRISVLSGFVNPAGTKLVVMQATDFRP